MAEAFTFKCDRCGRIHKGAPGFGYEMPIEVLYIPEAERAERVHRTSEICAVDDTVFSIRGCVEIPIEGLDAPFVWGMWIAVPPEAFLEYSTGLDNGVLEPSTYSGLLTALPPMYPDETLQVTVQVRPIGTRPLIAISPCSNPFFADQQAGYTRSVAQEIMQTMLHRQKRQKKPWWRFW